MKKRQQQSNILDQFGRPYSLAFFEGGDRTSPRERPHAYYHGNQDTHKLLSNANLGQLRSAGRFLFTNVPIVRGAVKELANYAFPLEPQYMGADKGWGRAAEEWLHEWHKVFHVQGPNYNLESWLPVHLTEMCVDGDHGILFKSNKARDFPLIQDIRGHRIDDSQTVNGRVEKGRYSGRRIVSGVILNEQNRAIAYRILGDSGKKDDFEDVPARAMMLNFQPDNSDQVRGISRLVASITSFADIKRLRDYEMRAQQIFSSLSLIENNEEGEEDTAADAVTVPDSSTDTSGTAAGLVTRTFESGLIRYFKSNTGSGLEAFRGDRPSSDASAFEDKIVTGALYGLGWDPNFALAIKEPGGAWARTVIQKVNRSIQNAQKQAARALRRIDIYGLAFAIQEGILDDAPDGDIFSWEYQGPAKITADSGNDEKARRENYKMGHTTLRKIYADNGDWWQEQRDQRQVEINDLMERSTELSQRWGIPMDQAIRMFEDRETVSAGTAQSNREPEE